VLNQGGADSGSLTSFFEQIMDFSTGMSYLQNQQVRIKIIFIDLKNIAENKQYRIKMLGM